MSSFPFGLMGLKVLLSTLGVSARSWIENFSLIFYCHPTAMLVRASDKIESNLWSASVAKQSAKGPEMHDRPQLGESMFDVGMAAP